MLPLKVCGAITIFIARNSIYQGYESQTTEPPQPATPSVYSFIPIVICFAATIQLNHDSWSY